MVAGKDQAGGFAVFLGLDAQRSGTQNMPGVVVGHTDARRGFETLVVVHGLKQGGRLLGVFHGIQRRRRILKAAAVVLSGFPAGFHLLDVGAVLEHDFQQLAGGHGAVDRACEAVTDQQRQKAGVIDMGVGDQDEVNVAGLVDFALAVAGFNGFVALMHAAVHAETPAPGLDHVAGAGHGLRRAQKLNLHASLLC